MTRVLVVDDSELSRQMVCEAVTMLEDDSVQVTDTAVNGAEALQKLYAGEFDLVTLDLQMPKLDGLSFLDKAMQMHPDLPVIVISSMTSTNLGLQALKKGAKVAIPKERVDVPTLAEALNTLIYGGERKAPTSS